MRGQHAKRLRDIRPQGGERILIVDDNPSDRTLVERFLTEKQTNISLSFATSAEEALALAAKQKFDCAIIDYRLPGMNGIQLTEALHARDVHGEFPVVMLTGFGTESTVVEALHTGVADYLSKEGMTPTAIRRAVFTAITHSRLTTEIAAKTKRLEEANLELQRRHREIQSVYHTISHEIKTPLTAAREFSSLVGDGVLGEINDEQKDAMEHVIACCDQLTTHFNDLLDFARANVGKIKMRIEKTEIQPLVRRAVASITRLAREKNIDVRIQMDDEFPEMHIDGSRVIQVLANLLTNAAKFTAENGRIVVIVTATKQPMTGIRIDVSDNGCGIPQQDLAHIFESLYQVTINETSIHDGLGLGLSIARSIVDLHGGEITVESTVDVGSTFSVFLPCKPIVPEQTGKFAVLNVDPESDTSLATA